MYFSENTSFAEAALMILHLFAPLNLSEHFGAAGTGYTLDLRPLSVALESKEEEEEEEEVDEEILGSAACRFMDGSSFPHHPNHKF